MQYRKFLSHHLLSSFFRRKELHKVNGTKEQEKCLKETTISKDITSKTLLDVILSSSLQNKWRIDIIKLRRRGTKAKLLFSLDRKLYRHLKTSNFNSRRFEWRIIIFYSCRNPGNYASFERRMRGKFNFFIASLSRFWI